MRELTDREISILEEQGCWAEEWSDIIVDDSFMTDTVRNVTFYGHIEIGSLMGTISIEEGFRRRCGIRNATLRNVTIGDDCLIENIHGYISGYTIGDHCYISNAGTLTCQEDATFGIGTKISVLNEGGNGNVTLSEELTAQVAWFMINTGTTLRTSSLTNNPEEYQGKLISNWVRITNVRDISNVKVGEYCEIQGASRISNCSLMSTEDACTFIGSDVIMESSIVAPGATVTDGAKVMECFVGESVHIGKGFSAESSLFFANSHMDNGESCAALCGPFSTSHHKSTLLIGGAFSFYNAGSNTNQSNHAYKMGPIHWGILDRGSKTASGCHILWPAHIGAFSMAMGKITTHPQTYKLPFSYVIAEGSKTYLVPGINIRTVGTWRDVSKWPKRDLRPVSSRSDIINFAFLNPHIIQYVLEGRKILENLISEQREDDTPDKSREYTYNGCHIRHSAALRGIGYYDLIIRLFLNDHFTRNSNLTEESTGGRWLDICGMLAPATEIDRIMLDIQSGAIATIAELREVLQLIDKDYKVNCAAYANHIIEQLYRKDGKDMESLIDESEESHKQWLNLIRQDAEKEFRMGDVEESQLRDFIEKIH